MNNKATFTIEFSLQEGRQEDFKKIVNEAIAIVEASEQGALNYQFYFNADESKCYVMEQYSDSSAMMTHLNNVSAVLNEILKISSITRLEIFGSLSAEACAVAESLGAVFYNHYAGFTR